MGIYLNNDVALSLYNEVVSDPYFVDKSAFLLELFPRIGTIKKSVCVTRPRRFGKTINAAMVAAFFCKGADSSAVFDSLRIAEHPQYRQHLNQYNVIFIDFLPSANCSHNYQEFITRIEKQLSRDLRNSFPNVDYFEEIDPVMDLADIYAETGEKFILDMDEWDSIFSKGFMTEEDRKSYTGFLAALTKSRPYLALTYMTGVLPIAKYSSSSTINHFDEYNMGDSAIYAEYFGFTESEVDELYLRYLRNVESPAFSREGLRQWYDGYLIKGKENVYNPRSVVNALTEGELGSYWTNTGRFNEIANLILLDTADLQNAVIQMLDGGAVPIVFRQYAASYGRLDTLNHILSAMVTYGFLTYNAEEKTVRIPNKELMQEFEAIILDEPRFGYVNRLAAASARVLQATLTGDAGQVAEILEHIHNESPLLDYNSEAELSHVVYLAYLTARDRYTVQREAQSGRGRTDHLFLPKNPSDTGFIVEVKLGGTPDQAIQQIKEKRYALALRNPIGVEPAWICSKILAVGISYDAKSGGHCCKIEELSNNMADLHTGPFVYSPIAERS